MSAFNDEFQRRLRAVLELRTRAPIPSDAVVTVESRAYGSDDDSRGLDCEIRISTPVTSYGYDEPGAWPKLLADLEAVPPQEKA
jgi:hypothetical protein